MAILIRGARVLDPGNLDAVCDVFIKTDRIAAIRPTGTITDYPDETFLVDAGGLVLTPGLIDLHVHLREPGQEHKETIMTGTGAAAAGGFTSVCAMPNTDPVNDTADVTRYIIGKARQAGLARVYPVGAISRGLKGEALCDYKALRDAGAVAVSDDGRPVTNARLMRRAMESAMDSGLKVISHCEDLTLAGDGAMNEGPRSARMGLAGIPGAAESIMVMRDIALAELTGVPIHIAHVSARCSVEAIRRAKNDGIAVTAETAPHYFTLTDEAVEGYKTNAKMNPPLRAAADRDAIRRALVDGVIDMIATDHAPHAPAEKELPFEQAPNGVIGLETALPLGLKLVHDGLMDLSTLIEKMACAPARFLNLEHGVRKGARADLTLIDPELSFTVRADAFRSKSRNTPFDGMRLKGRAVMTLVGGKVVFDQTPRSTNGGRSA